jgi:hypothetical protein
MMKSIPANLKQSRTLLPNIALITATLILAACGEKPQPPAPQAPPPKLFQQDRDALDKAKQVGQTEAKGADEMKREEEKQTK